MKKIVKYTNTYRSSYIDKEVSASLGNIKPGDIIHFNYPSENNSNPYVLVLSPKFENKLHGLALDYISTTAIKQMASQLAHITKLKALTEHIRANTLSNNPKSYFESYAKRAVDALPVNAYRTYDVTKISSVKSCLLKTTV